MISYTITDTGRSFLSHWNNTITEFPYGNISLALINMNIDALNSFLDEEKENLTAFIKHTKHIYNLYENGRIPNGRIQYHNSNKTIDIADYIADIKSELLISFDEDIIQLLDNSYLDTAQLQVMSLAITTELSNNIMLYSFDPNHREYYFPYVLHSKKMREQIKSILLNPSLYFTGECLEYVNMCHIDFTIQNHPSQGLQKVYHLEDFTTLFILDIQQFILNQIQVKECQNPKCKRLFIPTSGKNKLYCSLRHKDTKLTCAQIMHNNPTDRFAVLARKARGKQQGFYINATGRYHKSTSSNSKYIYDIQKLEKKYEEWQYNLSDLYEKCRASDDYKTLEKWVDGNYFNSSNLIDIGVKTINPAWESKHKKNNKKG